MTTSRTTAKRATSGASRSRTGRASGSPTSRKSTSTTSRKTTAAAKQAAAKTTSAKTSSSAKKAAAGKGAARAPAGRTGAAIASETVDTVRELAAVVENHGLSEMILELPGATLTLRRAGGAGDAASASLPSSPLAAQASMVSLPAAAETPASSEQPAADASPAAAKPTGHLVTSPFVGTFYRAPNPDTSPYVDVGTRVEKGQPLCIVEAMKLMNEIEADQSGVIAAVFVENAEPVEYGQALFEIAPE